MTKKRLVRAVHTKDLEEFLRTSGLWEDLVNGKLECDHCNTKLTLDEIARFIVEGTKVKILCCKSECLGLGSE